MREKNKLTGEKNTDVLLPYIILPDIGGDYLDVTKQLNASTQKFEIV